MGQAKEKQRKKLQAREYLKLVQIPYLYSIPARSFKAVLTLIILVPAIFLMAASESFKQNKNIWELK